MVSGLLSAVGDLTATSNGTSVTISWSPPFSLIPDIWYSVFIYNVTDENNPTAILCTNCTNITETHYTFTPDYLSPCEKFLFSVIPLNGAGQGESSGIVTGYIYERAREGERGGDVDCCRSSQIPDNIDEGKERNWLHGCMYYLSFP